MLLLRSCMNVVYALACDFFPQYKKSHAKAYVTYYPIIFNSQLKIQNSKLKKDV